MTTQYEETLARSAAYELLSLAFLYPEKDTLPLLLTGAYKLGLVASQAGWSEVNLALGGLARGLEATDMSGQALENEFVEVFGHAVSADCAPYEGEYGQAHIFQKSHTLADLAAFYQAFGVAPSPQLKDRADHISVELEFMHLLTFKEAYAHLHGHGEDKTLLCHQAQEEFLANHLATWVKSFAGRLMKKTGGGGVYGALANLLNTYMEAEFRRFRLDSTPTSAGEPPESPEADLECAAFPVTANVSQEVGTT